MTCSSSNPQLPNLVVRICLHLKVSTRNSTLIGLQHTHAPLVLQSTVNGSFPPLPGLWLLNLNQVVGHDHPPASVHVRRVMTNATMSVLSYSSFYLSPCSFIFFGGVLDWMKSGWGSKTADQDGLGIVQSRWGVCPTEDMPDMLPCYHRCPWIVVSSGSGPVDMDHEFTMDGMCTK